ncbi:MAG: thioredoxin domain-containing protein [Moorea sp. SIO3I7]|uniref:DsbA family protein n=1 Tax=Moorena sp. SIO3I8 TaxID=2607833 RepID=UPI0013C0D007|nr:thioredoxin domain-containing protein [Moorena sp. SIO3I8]NEN95072.1 thioredoxin domain-containing protein [Moorena sp. SIO3I7]NEO05008.1 thioredoxin domain-containing protein [Moorena sp. SIO3I8]
MVTKLLTILQKALSLTGLVLLLCFSAWSLPATAAAKITPELEQQILEVIRNHPEVILESVQRYQQQLERESQQRQQAILQGFKTNPQAFIGSSPATGSIEDKIVLVEFSDFQCPFCARAHDTVNQFIANHGDEVTLVYKHFPLTGIHPQALPAAQAAWAATQQGKFWQYHDALFANQKQLGEELYLAIAQDLDLDLEQFNRDRNAADRAIAEDMQLAQLLGLSGTPFFVMNGEAFSGAVPLEQIEAILAQVRNS